MSAASLMPHPACPFPKPIWRNGLRLADSPHGPVPLMTGDLQWFPLDIYDHARGGRWHQYDHRERSWFCIDPFDRTAIDMRPDHPPTIEDIRNF